MYIHAMYASTERLISTVVFWKMCTDVVAMKHYHRYKFSAITPHTRYLVIDDVWYMPRYLLVYCLVNKVLSEQ